MAMKGNWYTELMLLEEAREGTRHRAAVCGGRRDRSGGRGVVDPGSRRHGSVSLWMTAVARHRCRTHGLQSSHHATPVPLPWNRQTVQENCGQGGGRAMRALSPRSDDVSLGVGRRSGFMAALRPNYSRRSCVSLPARYMASLRRNGIRIDSTASTADRRAGGRLAAWGLVGSSADGRAKRRLFPPNCAGYAPLCTHGRIADPPRRAGQTQGEVNGTLTGLVRPRSTRACGLVMQWAGRWRGCFTGSRGAGRRLLQKFYASTP